MVAAGADLMGQEPALLLALSCECLCCGYVAKAKVTWVMCRPRRLCSLQKESEAACPPCECKKHSAGAGSVLHIGKGEKKQLHSSTLLPYLILMKSMSLPATTSLPQPLDVEHSESSLHHRCG